jgi:fatty acid desaturase
MPGLIQELISGNFSSPLSWVFLIFTLLAFFFLFRLAWLFFVKGDTFTDSVEGRQQVKNTVRILIICVGVALLTGFLFQFLLVGRSAAESSAPGAAQGFFDWLLGQ